MTVAAVRHCEGCGAIIHPDRPPHAKHCGDGCRIAAHRRRQADAATAERVRVAAETAERARLAAEATPHADPGDSAALARSRLATTADDHRATLAALAALADQLTTDAGRRWRGKTAQVRLADRLADAACRGRRPGRRYAAGAVSTVRVPTRARLATPRGRLTTWQPATSC